MKWWKCEKCKGEAPCFLATPESCNGPAWCPWASDLDEDGDLEAEWVECSPAPHEPTNKKCFTVEVMKHKGPVYVRKGEDKHEAECGKELGDHYLSGKPPF